MSNFPCHASGKILTPYYQNCHFLFWIDIDRILKTFKKYHFVFLINIDPIFKISKNLFEFSDIFQHVPNFGLPTRLYFPKEMFGMNWFSRNMLSILGSPKINNICLGSHGHVPKSDNHGNDGFSGFPKKNHKSHYVEQIEAE